MLKLSKSRLLKFIPLIGWVVSVLLLMGLLFVHYLVGDVPHSGGELSPAGNVFVVAFVIALGFGVLGTLLFFVATQFIRLQTAIVLPCVVIGFAWNRDEPFISVIVATLVGLYLGGWAEQWWKAAIDRAEAEEAGAAADLVQTAEAGATLQTPEPKPMLDGTGVHLPRYIPLLGIVLFLLLGFAIDYVFAVNGWEPEPISEVWVFSFIPALLCVWIARDAEALPAAIVIECLILGVWAGETVANLRQDLQGATYITAFAGMTIGFGLADRVRNWLKSDNDGDPVKEPSSPSAGA